LIVLGRRKKQKGRQHKYFQQKNKNIDRSSSSPPSNNNDLSHCYSQKRAAEMDENIKKMQQRLNSMKAKRDVLLSRYASSPPSVNDPANPPKTPIPNNSPDQESPQQQPLGNNN